VSGGPKPFTDRFSTQAAAYATSRPRYPAALFELLAALAPACDLAWDCATGSGQAALGLAEHFARVIATDLSDGQLRHAERHPRVTYRRADAHASGLDAGSVDVVTVAQALHWLDHAAFFAEVQRVLRPRGVVAVWCYDLVRIAPEVDAVVDRYYHETLRDDWAPERRLVDEHYRTIPFPFEELEAPPFTIELRWTRPRLLGYLRSWSATRAYQERTGRDPLPEVERALERVWPDPEAVHPARWALHLRLGRSGPA
jgi:SAM-dependent methyltransferase